MYVRNDSCKSNFSTILRSCLLLAHTCGTTYY